MDKKDCSHLFLNTINEMRALKAELNTSLFTRMSFIRLLSRIQTSNKVYGLRKAFSCGDIWTQGKASVNSRSSTIQLTKNSPEEEVLDSISETDQLIKELTDDAKQLISSLVELLTDQSSEEKEKVLQTMKGDVVNKRKRFRPNLQKDTKKFISKSIGQPSTSSQSTRANLCEPGRGECEAPGLWSSQLISRIKITEDVIQIYENISQIQTLKAGIKRSIIRLWCKISLMSGIQYSNKVSQLRKSLSCSEIWTQEEASVDVTQSPTNPLIKFFHLKWSSLST